MKPAAVVHPTLDALATYVSELARCADAATRAEDRAVYTAHLAAAARLFALARSGRSDAFAALLEAEGRAYGRGFLSGQPGRDAEAAFARFAAACRPAGAAT